MMQTSQTFWSGVFLLFASMLRYFPGTEEEPVLKVLGSQDLGTMAPCFGVAKLGIVGCPGMPYGMPQERSAIL